MNGWMDGWIVSGVNSLIYKLYRNTKGDIFLEYEIIQKGKTHTDN